VALQALLDATIDHLLLAGPHALTETKGLLAALGLLAPPDYAEAAAAAFARCAASEETAEGIAAFREKRRPRWAGQPAGKSGAGMAR
jgi:isohexenylglutaconyl-CoA hydratase